MFISWYGRRKQDERLSKVAQQVSVEVIRGWFLSFHITKLILDFYTTIKKVQKITSYEYWISIERGWQESDVEKYYIMHTNFSMCSAGHPERVIQRGSSSAGHPQKINRYESYSCEWFCLRVGDASALNVFLNWTFAEMVGPFSARQSGITNAFQTQLSSERTEKFCTLLIGLKLSKIVQYRGSSIIGTSITIIVAISGFIKNSK